MVKGIEFVEVEEKMKGRKVGLASFGFKQSGVANRVALRGWETPNAFNAFNAFNALFAIRIRFGYRASSHLHTSDLERLVVLQSHYDLVLHC